VSKPGILETSTLILFGRITRIDADAMIAADLHVYTCNPRDFTGIDGLELVEVPHPDHR
jgi:hypothetical protein